ncbi:MAG: 1-acyl-sn-glycerol-3-phosphate acyltransferase [Lentisphaeria bacterium]|nr:1-acyl-sn-glycerol-3-phosphate acyltransferase [Lentisphaeria bacterium]
MGLLRQIWKITLFLWWSALLMPAAWISQAGLKKWQRVRRGAFWAQFWAKGCAKIAGVKVRIHGGMPCESGVLLVSNHLGYLDILVHAAGFRLRFTPNSGIAKWFFIGSLVGLSSPVWIDRKSPRKAAEYAAEFRQTMDNGVSLLVYPEGTSTDGRHGLLPFKSTVFASVPEGVPIVPTLLFYREADGETAAWFDDTPFIEHALKVLKMKKIIIDLYVLPEIFALAGEDRKSLACRVRDRMIEEYEKYA